MTTPLPAAAIERLEDSLTGELQLLEQLQQLSAELLKHRSEEQRERRSHDDSRAALSRMEQAISGFRRQREATLAELQVLTGAPLRLAGLIARMEPESAIRMDRLRRELISKIVEIRSMNLAAQMSLIYRMDHYRQLLTAISGNSSAADIYQPTGRLENSLMENSLVQDC